MRLFKILTIITFFVLSEAFLGGEVVEDGEIPYQAWIKIDTEQNSTKLCTGSLIKPNLILTAAVCVKNFRLGIVVLGTANIEDISSSPTADVVVINRVAIHEHFNVTTLENNIALVYLNRNARLKEGVIETIALSPFDFSHERENALIGTDAGVSGWGDAPYLRRAYLTIIGNVSCFIRYKNVLATNICAGKIDVGGPCEQSYGAPLVATIDNEKTLVGVFSHTKGCETGTPGVYTRNSQFYNWIEKNL